MCENKPHHATRRECKGFMEHGKELEGELERLEMTSYYDLICQHLYYNECAHNAQQKDRTLEDLIEKYNHCADDHNSLVHEIQQKNEEIGRLNKRTHAQMNYSTALNNRIRSLANELKWMKRKGAE